MFSVLQWLSGKFPDGYMGVPRCSELRRLWGRVAMCDFYRVDTRAPRSNSFLLPCPVRHPFPDHGMSKRKMPRGGRPKEEQYRGGADRGFSKHRTTNELSRKEAGQKVDSMRGRGRRQLWCIAGRGAPTRERESGGVELFAYARGFTGRTARSLHGVTSVASDQSRCGLRVALQAHCVYRALRRRAPASAMLHWSLQPPILNRRSRLGACGSRVVDDLRAAIPGGARAGGTSVADAAGTAARTSNTSTETAAGATANASLTRSIASAGTALHTLAIPSESRLHISRASIRGTAAKLGSGSVTFTTSRSAARAFAGSARAFASAEGGASTAFAPTFGPLTVSARTGMFWETAAADMIRLPLPDSSARERDLSGPLVAETSIETQEFARASGACTKRESQAFAGRRCAGRARAMRSHSRGAQTTHTSTCGWYLAAIAFFGGILAWSIIAQLNAAFERHDDAVDAGNVTRVERQDTEVVAKMSKEARTMRGKLSSAKRLPSRCRRRWKVRMMAETRRNMDVDKDGLCPASTSVEDFLDGAACLPRRDFPLSIEEVFEDGEDFVQWLSEMGVKGESSEGRDKIGGGEGMIY
ncbi:hypothetical protein B0H13DRAFT_1893414 [Mycena leptocephala]|nr:hypothetical protein B0H13DRAFT_1893414 [Mycena leptocephala]